MTIAELDQWAIRRRWGHEKREAMERFLGKFVIEHGDRELCRLWADVRQETRAAGFEISVADAWIAAVAWRNNAPLITRNARDYRGVSSIQVIGEAG